MNAARRERGFSLIELLVAMAIFGAAMVPILYVVAAAQRLARSQPEATDLQQRVRVAVDKLRRDLTMAGAGPVRGRESPAIGAFVPGIIPARTGLRSPDPELSVFPDRLSIFYVPDDGWDARVVEDMAHAAAALRVDAAAAGCPGAGFCGFDEGQRALVLDPGGVGLGHEVFTVTGVAGEVAHEAPNPPFSRAYRAGARLMPIVQRVYHFDRENRRLMLYDGGGSDMPLVDNVVDVRFEYFVDGSPAGVIRPPPGESSCLYAAGPPLVPRLEDLGRVGLTSVAIAQLGDGPVCGLGRHRFDGDLLRIRLVRVLLRLQAAGTDVRGRGRWFERPGNSTSGYSFVPDFEVTFDVAPRNLLPSGGPP